MVPDTPQVEETLFGDLGVSAGASAGDLVIDMSSISPLATKEFAAKLGEKGVAYLDAPVSGGEVGAKAATLTIMVGGSAEAFARAKPLFECVGKNITHIGPNGDGQTAKVANQMIVALTIAAVGEALLFASKAGADPAKVRDALLGGFAGSRVLEVHGKRMLERTFDPGFRIKLHHKDLALALESANALGLPLPQTAFCQQMLNAACAAGEGGLDHSALVRSLERLASHALA
jgi:2-hydroxy-3-oxopropionate reductase